MTAPAPGEGSTASLIVCTTAREDRVPALLERCAASVAYGGSVAEVVLVDNSSTARLLRGKPNERPAHLPPGVRVVRGALRGLSHARTTGCIQARGDVLVFTDDDVEFDAGWAHRLAQPVLSGTLDAAAAPVRLGPEFDHVRSPMLRGWLAEANLDEGDERLVGAGMAIGRSLFGLGLWDARIGAGAGQACFGEETLFEAMIRAHGARVGVVRSAEALHHPDLDRLSPDFWRRTARSKGLSDAYVSYHWWGRSLPKPLLRIARRRIRLAAFKRSVSNEPDRLVEELRLIESVYYAVGFRRESRGPRVYHREGWNARAAPDNPSADGPSVRS